MVLDGVAGAGKSVLVDAAADTAHRYGYRVLQSRPAEAETGFSFAGLRDLMDGVYDEYAPTLPGPQEQALAAALLRAESGDRPASSTTVAAATLTVLRSMATRQPLCVVVDDVQWLDPSTASVLSFAARRLTGERVVFILAVRSGAPNEPMLLLTMRRAFADDRVQTLPVGPLSVGAVAAMLRRRLRGPFSGPLIRRIHSAAGGNPFFALELGRALLHLERPLHPGEPLPLPRSLGDLVSARLSQLPGRIRRHLPAVAALSQPTVQLLLALEPRCDIDDDLALGVEAGILRLDRDRVRFAHPLFAEHCLGGLSSTECHLLHRRLAALDLDVEERARHLGLATAGADESTARVLDEAAVLAFNRGAAHSAADLARRARELTPPPLIVESQRRTLACARYQFVSGDVTAAISALVELEHPDVSAALRAQALSEHARINLFTDDLSSAAELFAAATAQTSARDDTRGEAAEGLAWCLLLLRRDVGSAASHARRAVKLAQRSGNQPALAEALATQAVCDGMLGRPGALAVARRAMAVSAGYEYPRVIRSPVWALAVLLTWHDELTEASTLLGRLCRQADERGDESSMPRLLFALSHVHLLLGTVGKAVELAEQAQAAAIESGQRGQVGMVLFAKIVIDSLLGDATATTQEGRQDDLTSRSASQPITATALGHLELSRGNFGHAHANLGLAVEVVRRAGVVEPGAMRFAYDDVEALVGLGRTEEAADLLEWLQRCATTTGRTSALAACAQCCGLLLAATGDTVGALSALESALAQCRPDLPLDRARTLLCLGVTRRRARQKRNARAALDEAQQLFAGLGMVHWEQRARVELGRIGGRQRSSTLTPTEQRMADLVAAAFSNREIANALFVTVRTVETTLSHVFAKLGVRSRTELAGQLAKRALAEGEPSRASAPRGVPPPRRPTWPIEHAWPRTPTPSQP